MEKTKLKTSPLSLRKETLRRLQDSELRGVAGVARVRIPIGFAEDTTPIGSYDDLPRRSEHRPRVYFDSGR
jgi:hypothetical protein